MLVAENTAAQSFSIGQRVRILPHPDGGWLTGREGEIVDMPRGPFILGTGDYGVYVKLDDFTYHFYSHRIEVI